MTQVHPNTVTQVHPGKLKYSDSGASGQAVVPRMRRKKSGARKQKNLLINIFFTIILWLKKYLLDPSFPLAAQMFKYSRTGTP